MKHFAYISLIIWFVTTLPAHAQYEYTLKQCLEEGLLNNYSPVSYTHLRAHET